MEKRNKKKEQELQMVFKQSCALGTGTQSECMDKAKHKRTLDGAFIFVDSITAMEGTAANSAKTCKIHQSSKCSMVSTFGCINDLR